MKKTLLCFILALVFLPLGASGQEIVEATLQPEKIPDVLELIPLTEKICQVRGMRRMVNDCTKFPLSDLDERIQNYNEILDGMEEHIPTYMYFAESSRSHPIEFSFPEDSEAYTYLKQRLHVDHFGHLAYDTFEQFCQYYYSTDHHWNYKGSYQAYVDIVRMLKGEEESVLVPEGVVTFPVIFDGSFSREIKLSFSQEYFSIYRFGERAEYTAYVNGKKRAYDHMDNYLRGTINTNALVNHYALCYGGDYGMIVFENAEQSGKGTLLMFGNSMSNAVKTLLIQHYDRIVYIDLRHYATSRGIGKPFSMSEIVTEYHPDQILLLSDLSMYRQGDPMEP